MESSGFPTPEHDEAEERYVRSDLETLKRLYGLLDKTVAINTDSNANNEEIMLPGPMLTPRLANALSIKRSGQSTNYVGLEQNINNCLRHSVRGDTNFLKSQFSIKSRQNQAQRVPNQASCPYHPMSRYQSRSGINQSSRPLTGGILINQYQKERSSYCLSEHQPNSNAVKTAELTPKRILASPLDRTNSIQRPVSLDRVSSPREHMNLQHVPYKIENQNLEPENDSSTDGIESNRGMLNQRNSDKFTKRTLLEERLPVIDHKKKLRDNLPNVSSSQSNSDTSSESSRNSPSPSKQRLSMIIQKDSKITHPLGATHPKRHLIPHYDLRKPFQRIESRNSFSSSKRILPMVIQKSGHPLGATHSRRQLQHDHYNSLQRIHGTCQEVPISQRNLKKPAKEADTPDKKRGHFNWLKEKLGTVLHHRHDHHHYHHHHSEEDESSKDQDNKNRHHRSLWKYLKRIVHHPTERTSEIVPPQHRHHRHMRTLFHMMFGHLRGNKGRKKTRLSRRVNRVRVNKLHWLQKFRRRGRMKVTNGRGARLRLPGRKGGTNKKYNKR